MKRNQPQNPSTKKPRRKYKAKKVDSTSPAGVLQLEISQLLAEHDLEESDIANPINEILNNQVEIEKFHRVVENVKILKLTSSGDGLALIPHPSEKFQIALVPFGLPGDVATIRVFKTHPLYVESDLLQVVESSFNRDDQLIKCKYFGACSGCQFQAVQYKDQLELKRTTIQNAYKLFASSLCDLPAVSETHPSSLQYGYRTKLTPHFDMPRRIPEDFKRPNLGFGSKGRPEWREIPEQSKGSILDIEECVIGTPIINMGMANERTRFLETYKNYKKGATILLRENSSASEVPGSTDNEGKVSSLKAGDLIKTCTTNTRQIVKEYINRFQFEFSAGEFFQNNNSILPDIIRYVQDNLQLDDSKENYLIDAYCGSGLFSICSSHSVTKVIGVEISADSVKFATRNAELNKIENTSFIVGKAEKIFADIELPNDKTCIILDPPRKGCDEVFLNQLAEFNPVKILYISCNVHSQARDVEFFLTKTEKGAQYKVESIKGFDFFPQTHHVESVAVLALK